MKSKEGTPFGRFERFVKAIVNVPGSEVKREIEREKIERKKKKRVKTSPASHVSRAKG